MCQNCLPGELLLARAVAPAITEESLASLKPADSLPVVAKPNVYFHNGSIITMKDGLFSPVDALAIDSSTGKISAVGTLEEVKAVAGSGAKEFNLDGRCLLPGFIEPHLHLATTSLIGDVFVDLRPLTVTKKDQALSLLKEKVAKFKPGQWLAGFGYDPSRVEPFDDNLSASDLDTVSTTVNIFVLNASGHLAYVNHCAFKTCGIDKNTPNPPGGTYEHDPCTGELTGAVTEQAIRTFAQNLKQPSVPEFVLKCIQTLKDWSRAGCTTIFDAGIGLLSPNNKDEILLMAALSELPTCPVRITGALAAAYAESILQLKGTSPPYKYGKLSLQSIKVFSDGSTQGFTGAVREPYLNNKGWGFLDWSDGDIRTTMQAWQQTGWQLVVHSNADRAIDQVLGAYDWVLAQSCGKYSDILHRIDHFTVTHSEQLQAAKKLNLAVTHLIGHVYYWGQVFRDQILGPKRANRIDPVKEDNDTGLIFSFHSDSPVTLVNPLLYVKTAVTRELYNTNPVQVLGADQCVDLETALRGVTINPAKQCMLGDVCGTLEVGKSADLVLLGQDPRQVEATKLDQIPVLGTWLSGRQVWGPEEEEVETRNRARLTRARL